MRSKKILYYVIIFSLITAIVINSLNYSNYLSLYHTNNLAASGAGFFAAFIYILYAILLLLITIIFSFIILLRKKASSMPQYKTFFLILTSINILFSLVYTELIVSTLDIHTATSYIATFITIFVYHIFIYLLIAIVYIFENIFNYIKKVKK